MGNQLVIEAFHVLHTLELEWVIEELVHLGVALFLNVFVFLHLDVLLADVGRLLDAKINLIFSLDLLHFFKSLSLHNSMIGVFLFLKFNKSTSQDLFVPGICLNRCRFYLTENLENFSQLLGSGISLEISDVKNFFRVCVTLLLPFSSSFAFCFMKIAKETLPIIKHIFIIYRIDRFLCVSVIVKT